ncbi:hypothetical protein C8F01DRAFT_1299413 [Mycena amicta]|nr:hypothetical protein C8F01DRAFT_1299413 [Mycena amicta]
MRAHRGNMPTSLPQDKRCPFCSARFTRTTHLTRHVKTHTAQRDYKCPTCPAEFTRSDLLRRHSKTCADPSRPVRSACVKCDRNTPACSRCQARGSPCIFAAGPRKRAPRVPEVDTPSSMEASSSSSTGSSTIQSLDLPPPPEPPLTLESLAKELALAASTITLPLAPPVNSHLSPLYKDDVFQPLFSDVFDPGTTTTACDDSEFPLSFPVIDEITRHTPSLTQPWFQELIAYPQRPAPKETASQQLVDQFFTRQLQTAEPKHYLYLFFNVFSCQMPIVHSATFKLEDKPLFLVKCMKACGALFVRTRKASNYIKDALTIAREGLTRQFARTSIDQSEQVHLVIAVVLLQTIGLFNEKEEERITSASYHAMLVVMIRRTGLISKIRDWKPAAVSGNLWQEWAMYEMTKRRDILSLLLHFLHDCCQSIYFGLRPSYLPGEVSTLRLPCDDRLWRAQTAEEWLSMIQPLPVQPPHNFIAGHLLSTTLSDMMHSSLDFLPVPNLSAFAHFILIHGILRDLFTACSESVNTMSPYEADEDDAPHRTVLAAQYAIHNWLQSWISCPAATTHNTEEPPFVENALPFYWLGQIAILAHQEGLPPFDSVRNATGEMRFKIVKRWLRRVRTFLAEGDNQSTVFWDELMKIRLQSWQVEFESDGGGDDDGLLGFFPSTV